MVIQLAHCSVRIKEPNVMMSPLVFLTSICQSVAGVECDGQAKKLFLDNRKILASWNLKSFLLISIWMFLSFRLVINGFCVPKDLPF